MAENETAVDTVAAELATLLPRLPRVKITPETITQTTIDRWYGYETEYRQTIAELRAELATANHQLRIAQIQTDEANERAERAGRSAQLLLDGQNELDRQRVETNAATRAEFEAAMDELRNQRDEARARLAKLGKMETQRRILTADGTSHPVTEWDLENRALWVPSVRLEEREVYPMPWRAVYPTCRSCGTAERVAGDPPLCSSCAVYGAGWSSQRPDASLDGLRGPFTGLLGPLGIAPDVQGDDDA